MRYFAKYLPVEGEIKEQMVLATDTNAIFHMHEKDYEGAKLANSLHLYKKVQLFLCSRDIRVGDTNVHTGILVHDNEEIVKEVKDESQLRFMQGVAEANKVVLFKVLGPISPDATWVKEGDDILSKNVHRGVYKMGHKGWMVVDCEDSAEEWEKEPAIAINGWAKCYLIEGPCGHMH